MELQEVIQNLCQPAFIYFILSGLSSLLYLYAIIERSETIQMNGLNDYTLCGLISHIVFSIFWTYILNSLCKTSLGKKFAWLFVLFPFIMMGLVIIGIFAGLTYLMVKQEKLIRQ